MLQESITYGIIGCAMEVHRILGRGFPEFIYHRALAVEFENKAIRFQHEPSLAVYYKEKELGSLRADFVVEGNVILEIKALTQLDDSHFAQSLNYIEAFNFGTGLLLNFGGPSLEFRRLFNNKNKSTSSGLPKAGNQKNP